MDDLKDIKMSNTVVYLIRHSVRLNNDEMIDTYKTSQTDLIKAEKNILSVEGEKRAEILSNKDELQNIDVVYTSNCVRTLQTAKYLLYKQNLKANIDERLDERRIGIRNDTEVPNHFTLQYLDENYKTVGGESQKDVRERITEVFNEIIEKNKGKRIAIFSHGFAICFFLLKWCKLINISENRTIEMEFNGKTVCNKKINSPDVFKLVLNDDNEVISIENIVFNDLEYKDFKYFN